MAKRTAGKRMAAEILKIVEHLRVVREALEHVYPPAAGVGRTQKEAGRVLLRMAQNQLQEAALCVEDLE